MTTDQHDDGPKLAAELTTDVFVLLSADLRPCQIAPEECIGPVERLPTEPPPADCDLLLPVTWPPGGPQPIATKLVPSRSTTVMRPPFGPSSGRPFGQRTVHVLAALPPERFQGALGALLPALPPVEPAPSTAACPRDPQTGELLMSEPEPIDHSLTTWVGRPLDGC